MMVAPEFERSPPPDFVRLDGRREEHGADYYFFFYFPHQDIFRSFEQLRS